MAKSDPRTFLDVVKNLGKLDRFFDMGQKEVALYYPIWREKTYAAEDEKTLPQVKIDTFLGADLTNSPANADENRSPDCENMIRDVPGKVRKRMGWQVKRTLDGRINGYHALMGHDPLVHAGTKLYKGDSVVYSDANDARSRSWEFGEKLYIADGKALLCYDGTAVTRVDADAYIPTLTIARAPNGGGEEYENANLICPKYREQFLGTAEDKTYQA